MKSRQELAGFAADLALQMGRMAEERRGSVDDVRVKADTSLVTDVDETADRMARQALAEAYPGHSILTEEDGLTDNNSEYVWVIDPLDGTTNYAKGVPLYAVSIGVLQGREPVAGVVYAPGQDELFLAVKDGGAQLNGVPLTCPARPLSPESTVAVDSLFIRQPPQAYLERVLSQTKMRNLGTAALNLAYVASGRFDANVAERLRLWDCLAGALVCREAGAQVVMPGGRPLFPLRRSLQEYTSIKVPIFAAGPGVFDELAHRLLYDCQLEETP